jgi:hypothetical protein
MCVAPLGVRAGPIGRLPRLAGMTSRHFCSAFLLSLGLMLAASHVSCLVPTARACIFAPHTEGVFSDCNAPG